ncbi:MULTISPECIES: YafY family protein [unclassified Actinotalea]|uniref:helix-turn-helix transcriptional regulator n=1 Tax=unclassified Actinotalea TaxID=2638618 RepID=UPI0015F50142|nr:MULTISPECIES: YafY family protein [unclassified Actinotalea]
MAVTSSRTLRLLSLLQARRHWGGADLADRLGVSLRTLRRDVERLRELGYPVEGRRGADGGYAMTPGACLPPLLLDDDEAVAIAVGLSAAATAGVAGLAGAAVKALAKIVPVMPAPLRRRTDALRAVTVAASWSTPGDAGDGVDTATLVSVAVACRDEVRLAFSYTSRAGAASDRHVEPFRVVPVEGTWYLVAWDLDRVDWRVFRLDRVRDVVRSGTRFAPHRLPADDAAAYVRERVSGGPGRLRVEAVVEAPAAEVRRRVRWWLSVEEEGPDRCRVRLDVDDPLWGATALALTGAPFTVVGPPELVPALRDVAARFTAAAGAPQG